jgi:hypothetical protein
VAQQAFSSDQGSTLHLAIPALETLHKAWFSRSERTKYRYFAPALEAAVKKLDEYYEKTTDSPAYIMAMCSFPSVILKLFQQLIMQCLTLPGKCHISRRIGPKACTPKS